MMARTRDTLTRVFVGLADVDEDRTFAHEFGSVFRGNCL